MKRGRDGSRSEERTRLLANSPPGRITAPTPLRRGKNPPQGSWGDRAVSPPPPSQGNTQRSAAGLASPPGPRGSPPLLPGPRALTSRPWSARTRTAAAPKCRSSSSFSAAVSSAGRCRTSSVRPRRRATPLGEGPAPSAEPPARASSQPGAAMPGPGERRRGQSRQSRGRPQRSRESGEEPPWRGSAAMRQRAAPSRGVGAGEPASGEWGRLSGLPVPAAA